MMSYRTYFFKISLMTFYLAALMGCSVVNKRIASKNTYSRDAMNEYRNDSLQMRILFHGNTYFGNAHIKLSEIRSLFDKHAGSSPRKDVILWGEYQAARQPMYLLGSIVHDIDLSKLNEGTSDFGSTYYYVISYPNDVTLTEAFIPISGGKYVHLQEMAMYAQNDLTASTRDAELAWKDMLRSLAVGRPVYDEAKGNNQEVTDDDLFEMK